MLIGILVHDITTMRQGGMSGDECRRLFRASLSRRSEELDLFLQELSVAGSSSRVSGDALVELRQVFRWKMIDKLDIVASSGFSGPEFGGA